MYEYSHKFFSYLQAFFAKKDIFLQKLVLDCLFPEKILTLIYRKEKRHGMNHVFKKEMYEYSHKFFSYLQAFFAKKDIFLQKLVLDCLFPEKILTLIYRKEQRHGMNHVFKKEIYEYSHKFFNYLQAFFAKKDREDKK